MYRAHFGLKEKPFRVVPSPRFLFSSDTHDESQARILYGIREARGFVVVTGGIGLGKTTVMYSVLEKLEGGVRPALVFNPVDNFHQLLRMMCMEFEIDTADADEVDLMYRLNRFLVQRLAAGESCVLIIDEAQNLPLEVLEKVRTLSNLQTEESSLLQVVLVGQDELKEKLHHPRLVQLRQRIGVWHELTALTAYETRSYIWHRLRLSGAAMPEALVVDAVCARVFELTAGIPRMINQLCETAFVIAYGRNAPVVSLEDVNEAARELHLLERAVPNAASLPEAPARASRAAEAPSPPVERARKRFSIPRPIAATLLVVALIILGYLSRPLWSNLLPAATPEARSETAQVADPEGHPPVESAPATFSPSPEYQRSCRQAEVVRARSTPVYSVHLGSFRSLDEANRFARHLIETSGDWTQPLFLESAVTDADWHRVLGGAFESRDQARQWMQRVRGQDGIGFARLDRLPRSAGLLEFSASPVAEEDDLEQHS